MHRIVTLLPSATEIVCALGFEDWMVGRSHECDYPESIQRLPILTSPKFKVEGSSREVNERVKTILRDALSVYRVDADKLRALNPDLIVTQSQCDVCAVSMRDVEEAVTQWIGTQPKIVSLAPYALEDVLADMERVASALDAPDSGSELVGGLTQRMKAITERAATAYESPRLAIIEWIDPLMAAGNWMPELVAMAGATNLLGDAGKHSPWLKFEEVAAKNPGVILIAPCGFGIERTIAELPVLTANPGWAKLRAVRDGKVYIVDGNQYFNRPGPRIAESLEILAEILHPELFNFGHENRGWRRIT